MAALVDADAAYTLGEIEMTIYNPKFYNNVNPKFLKKVDPILQELLANGVSCNYIHIDDLGAGKIPTSMVFSKHDACIGKLLRILRNWSVFSDKVVHITVGADAGLPVFINIED